MIKRPPSRSLGKIVHLESNPGLGLVIVGLALGAAGIYVGEADDAPGAALLGFLLMIVAMVLGIRTARRPDRGRR